MNLINDKKFYGIARVGNLSIAKLKCRREKFNSFRTNMTVDIKIKRNELQLDILNNSTKKLKTGEIANYTTFAMICPHNIIRHMLILFKRHDIRKLQEKINQLELNLEVLR